MPAAVFPLLVSNPSVSQTPAGGTTGGYQLFVVDNTGQRYALGELTKAQGETCTLKFNEAGSASFSIPTLDARTTAIVALARELQIWRHGRILWWGPIVRPEADAKRVHVQCRTLEWYFDKLYFGKADRTNLLVNPSFETGDLTGWTITNTTPVVTQSRFTEGAWSARLEQSSAQQTAYIQQIINNYAATAVGTNLVLAGYYFIDAAAWIGEAINFYGATIRRFNSAGTVMRQADVWEIDGAKASGAKGKWIRFEVSVNMPPDAIEDIEIRLWSPGGLIFWDALSLTIPESVSSATSPTDATDDVANLFAEIITHAQDPAFGKPALNIGIDAPLSGRRIDRTYDLDQHANIGDSLRQFANEGLGEWWVDFTATERTARFRSPIRGTRKPEFRVYLDGTAKEGTTHTNITDDFRFSFDGEQAASSVVVLGPGQGSSREEGAATAPLFGGNVYEAIVSAPPEANINTLDNLAAEHLATMSTPEIIRITYLPRSHPGAPDYLVSRDPIDSLHVGDTVPVFIAYGWVHIADVDYRIVAKEIDMQRDRATFTLNRAQ